ncbi:unnamed protein product [Pylaiella littoralis]
MARASVLPQTRSSVKMGCPAIVERPATSASPRKHPLGDIRPRRTLSGRYSSMPWSSPEWMSGAEIGRWLDRRHVHP